MTGIPEHEREEKDKDEEIGARASEFDWVALHLRRVNSLALAVGIVSVVAIVASITALFNEVVLDAYDFSWYSRLAEAGTGLSVLLPAAAATAICWRAWVRYARYRLAEI